MRRRLELQKWRKCSGVKRMLDMPWVSRHRLPASASIVQLYQLDAIREEQKVPQSHCATPPRGEWQLPVSLCIGIGIELTPELNRRPNDCSGTFHLATRFHLQSSSEESLLLLENMVSESCRRSVCGPLSGGIGVPSTTSGTLSKGSLLEFRQGAVEATSQSLPIANFSFSSGVYRSIARPIFACGVVIASDELWCLVRGEADGVEPPVLARVQPMEGSCSTVMVSEEVFGSTAAKKFHCLLSSGIGLTACNPKL